MIWPFMNCKEHTPPRRVGAPLSRGDLNTRPAEPEGIQGWVKLELYLLKRHPLKMLITHKSILQ